MGKIKNAEWKYVGGGEGIPGLPHVISTAEAEARGLQDLLQAAIDNKSYDHVPSGQDSGVSTNAETPSESDDQQPAAADSGVSSETPQDEDGGE